MNLEALFTLYGDLPRAGPGSDACTREALGRLPTLPERPAVLDLGCGPGRQTLVLAAELKNLIVAVDLHFPFLERLNSSAARQGLGNLIDTRCLDFTALPFPPGSFDLIWSEGAAYIAGFENALRKWKCLLKPTGHMAVTECTWLSENRPAEVRDYWFAAYPEMTTVAGNIDRARNAGLEVLDTFALPPAAWWADYYSPLAERARILRPGADDSLTVVLDEAEREIDLYRRHGDSYGYVFYLLRNRMP